MLDVIMKTIFGLVGASGAGKTTLILDMLKRMPDKLGVITSLTTRARRNEEDDLFYTFVTAGDMMQRKAEGRLVQMSEYAGNYYANDRKVMDALLAEKFGIAALVEEGINNLRHAGYHIVVIKIIPFHHPVSDDLVRKRADEERALTHLPADFILNNSFEPGGKEKAADRLAAFMSTYTH